MTPEEFRDLIIASHPNTPVEYLGPMPYIVTWVAGQHARKWKYVKDFGEAITLANTHNVHVHRGQAIVYQPASIR
jgi:hypothetical protein